MGLTGKLRKTLLFELGTLLAVAAAGYYLAGEFDVLERLDVLFHQHEDWEFDEILIVAFLLMITLMVLAVRRWLVLSEINSSLQAANADLESALAEVRQLRGIIPICASCKKIRDDQGFWHRVEAYVEDHSDAQFSHGICPECRDELYPSLSAELKKEKGSAS